MTPDASASELSISTPSLSIRAVEIPCVSKTRSRVDESTSVASSGASI
jgi:hypothetical protein